MVRRRVGAPHRARIPRTQLAVSLRPRHQLAGATRDSGRHDLGRHRSTRRNDRVPVVLGRPGTGPSRFGGSGGVHATRPGGTRISARRRRLGRGPGWADSCPRVETGGCRFPCANGVFGAWRPRDVRRRRVFSRRRRVGRRRLRRRPGQLPRLDRIRIVLTGGSWGGYLTLLGLGTQPDAWAVGVAGVPVADYVAEYQDEMEGLRAYDRALFGGSPDEVPDRYRQSSPITYVDDVVAPVFILAGANDPRCPIRQIDNYIERLTARSAPFEVYRFDAGHGSLVVEERIKQAEAEIDFARRHLPA